MAYTVQNLKDDIERNLRGTTLNKVQGVDDLIEQAGRDVLDLVDPHETRQISTLTLYDSIYDYSAPTDLKGNKIIDIRPQVKRQTGDNFSQTLTEQFDLKKGITNNEFAVQYDGGTKFLRINKSLTSAVVVDGVDGVTANGTWAGTDDATNLTKDTADYLTAGASLNFDVSGATTTATLTNSTLSSVNLSTHEDKSTLFMWLYIPDVTRLSSQTITLDWGSSASNYWTQTATTGHFEAFKTGWNLLKFNWNGATETGTGDASAINYLKVSFTYDGTADTDFRLDEISSRLGEIWEVVYYSKYLFTSSGTAVENIATDSDTINLDTDSYNLLLYRAMLLAALQLSSEDTGFDAAYYSNAWNQAKSSYVGKYPSELEKPRQYYYLKPYNKYKRR